MTEEPQKTGWPLTEDEKQYVLKAEHERRPGREQNKHMPELWPVVPSAGYWGGTAWLDMHAKLVKDAEDAKGAIDVLLVGDSITMQWGAAWQKHFGRYKTVNLGIGGDKTQNVLWRLDHGGLAGIEPRVIVLLIGNNNMFFTPETGIMPAARGIKMCVDIKNANAALDMLKFENAPKVHVLDLWNEFTNPDGSLKPAAYADGRLHLSPAGYEIWAGKLKPLVEGWISRQ